MAVETIRIQQLPRSRWEYVARKAANQIRNHVRMLEVYYEQVDKKSNPMQATVDALLDDPDLYVRTRGRIQHVCQRGAVRSGKSVISIFKPIEWMHRFPKTKWLCMRRTNAQLVGSMFTQIRETLDKFDIPHTHRLPSMTGPGEIRFPNESKFIFWSSESVVIGSKTDNARGLGSMEFAGATLEEADTLHKQAVDTVPQRISQQTGAPPIIFYNVNPTRTDHWIYQMFRERKDLPHPEDFHEFKFTLLDNEAHLGKGYIESQKVACAGNPALYKRFILGEWGPEALGDPIYGPYFSRDRHVASTSFIERWHRDCLYKDGDVVLCWDFGFKHPALVVFQDVKIGTFRQIRVLGAWLGDRITIGIFCRYIMTQLRMTFLGANYVSYGDPQGRNSDPRGVTTLNAFDVIQSETGLRTLSSKTDEPAGVDLIIKLLMQNTNHKLLGSQPEIIVEPNEYYTGDFIAMMEVGFCQGETEGSQDKLKPVNDQYFIHLADAFRYGVVHRRHPNMSPNDATGDLLGRTGYEPVSPQREIGASHYQAEMLELDTDIPMQTAYYGF